MHGETVIVIRSPRSSDQLNPAVLPVQLQPETYTAAQGEGALDILFALLCPGKLRAGDNNACPPLNELACCLKPDAGTGPGHYRKFACHRTREPGVSVSIVDRTV